MSDTKFESEPEKSHLGSFVDSVEGKNCWRESNAVRGAFIVDGESYFRAFRQALIQAETYVCILAWDFMGDLELIRDAEPGDDYPTKLVDFIYELVQRKPELNIYILLWDYSVVYLVEREWMPFSRFKQDPHDRIHLVTDDAINVGASHHQKVVIVDGSFAFNGGYDLSAWRWDTTEHKPEDKRRTTHKGESYQPFHDLHAAVTGNIVGALDQLCRERWKRATGEEAPWGNFDCDNTIWPQSLSVDFENEPTSLALTYSEYKEFPALRQVESLFLDMIAAAQRYIYIENQYLSSHTITDALIDRLEEKDGPEIVIVITRDNGGWLEEGTLGLLRTRLLEKMRSADSQGRLGAYYPHVQDESGNASQVYVHAKLIICDDRALMLGSANLSNRSMKVDSEIMMALGLEKGTRAAPAFLRRLLAIHLHAEDTEIDEALKAHGSLNTTIRSLREDRLHQLRDLPIGCSNPLSRKLADTQLLDPDEPIDPGYWLKKAIPGGSDAASQTNGSRYVKIGGALLVVFLIGLGLKEAWGDVITKESVETFFQSLNQSPWTTPLLFGIFFLAGLAAISINLLLVTATLVIGPWTALACGFFGSILSAIAGFLAGSAAGKPLLRKFFADRMDKLTEKIQHRGVLSIAFLRVVPIAPFVVINLVAGISGMKLRTFIAGSCLGMLPGMAAVVFATHQAKTVYMNPGWKTWTLLVVALLCLAGLSFGVKTFFKK